MKDTCKACKRAFEMDNSPYDGYGPSCGRKFNAPIIKGREHLLNANIQDEHDKYAFARESEFSNLGEDIKKSARHNFHEFRTIQEAEDNGQGEGFAKKSALLKLADIDFLDGINESNDLAKLTTYLALNKFPDKPEIYKQFNNLADEDVVKVDWTDRRTGQYCQIKTTAGEARAKARSQYVTLFNDIKNLTNSMMGNYNVDDFIGRLRKLVSSRIQELREGDPQNGFANQLAHFYNKQLLTNSNSISDINYHMKKLSGAERLEKIKELISDGKKSSGKVSKKPKTDKPTFELTYTDKVERIGKKNPYDTYEKQSKFLLDTVGLRGVQWGQYISDKERQEHMANITDSLNDFSEVVGIPVEKLSFDGQLGISVGARGKGEASAHYEPTLKVINITKHGAGALAHEYFHAVDDLLAKKLSLPAYNKGRGNYEGQNVTSCGNDTRVDKELRTILNNYDNAVDKFVTRMCREPMLTCLPKSKFDYWVNNRQELFARIGETIVQKKLERKGQKNTYLSGSEGTTVRPTDEELKEIEPHFEALMDYLKKKM